MASNDQGSPIIKIIYFQNKFYLNWFFK